MSNGVAFLNEAFLPDMEAFEVTGSANIPTAAGTFLLRRSHYFNVTKTRPELLASRTSVVIAFENASYSFTDDAVMQSRKLYLRH